MACTPGNGSMLSPIREWSSLVASPMSLALLFQRLDVSFHRQDQKSEGKRNQKRVQRTIAKCQQSTSGIRSRHQQVVLTFSPYWSILSTFPLKAQTYQQYRPGSRNVRPSINAGNIVATLAKQCTQSHEERCAVSLAGRANACPSSTRTYKHSNTTAHPPRRTKADKVKAWWMG